MFYSKKKFLGQVIAGILAGIVILAISTCSAHAWPVERVGVEGKIQEVERRQWLTNHTHAKHKNQADNKEYIYKSGEAEAISWLEDRQRDQQAALRKAKPESYADMPPSKDQMNQILVREYATRN